jgi:glutaredoxin
MSKTITELYTEGCQHCKKAREQLENKITREFPDAEIRYLDLLTEEGQQMAADYGVSATPAILVGDELISVGELDAQKLRDALRS